MADKDKFADEMLTNDELEGVTGGSRFQTFQLARKINKYKSSGIDYADIPAYLKEHYGIEAEIHYTKGEDEDKENVYYLNGEQITHGKVLGMLNSR